MLLLHVGGISKSFFVIKTSRDPISLAVRVSLSLFSPFIFFLAAPNSALLWHYFWLRWCIYTTAHQTPQTRFKHV